MPNPNGYPQTALSGKSNTPNISEVLPNDVVINEDVATDDRWPEKQSSRGANRRYPIEPAHTSSPPRLETFNRTGAEPDRQMALVDGPRAPKIAAIARTLSLRRRDRTTPQPERGSGALWAKRPHNDDFLVDLIEIVALPRTLVNIKMRQRTMGHYLHRNSNCQHLIAIERPSFVVRGCYAMLALQQACRELRTLRADHVRLRWDATAQLFSSF